MKPLRKSFLFASYSILMLLMGSVYTYSIYRPFLLDDFDVSVSVSGYPYMASLAFFAVSMFIFSRFIRNEYLPRLLIGGTLLLSGGFYVSAIATNIWVFTLGYGVLVGIGVGILYSIALNSVARYFDANIGFLSGLMLMAFGLSSVITSPLAQAFLSTNSLQAWFLLFALATFVFGILPLFLIQPIEWEVTDEKSSDPVVGFIVLFTLSTFIGLMMIGLSGFVGTQIYGFTGSQVSLLVSLFALGNAGARPIFGYLMDRYGFIPSMLLINGLVAVATMLNLLNQGSSIALFGISYFVYWFSLGAWLAMMPLFIKKTVGTAKYAAVYGKVFLGYGLAAIGGTLFSGIVLDALSTTTLIYVGILVLLSLITGFSFYLRSTKLTA
jgi:MFS transporter, OFA family, oxalate/formate antiporter